MDAMDRESNGMDSEFEERLLRVWAELKVDERKSVLDFAEFLAQGRGRIGEGAGRSPNGAPQRGPNQERGGAQGPDGTGKFVFLANSASREYHWVIRRVVLDDGHIDVERTADREPDGKPANAAQAADARGERGQPDGGRRGRRESGNKTPSPRRRRPRRES